MTEMLEHLPWVYLLSINLLEFFFMYVDKQRAKRRKWRIPEFNLLFIGMIGGGVGGLLAQQLFHHKTRKFHFYFCFIFGTLVTIAIIYFSYQK